MLIKKTDDLNIDFDDIQISDYWTCNDTKDTKMHKIHWYPAKFPAFLVEKSLKYAKEKNIEINNVADFFCGCGTTPLETKRLGYNFWGCDINPVATLIARVKSNKYNESSLKRYFNKIIKSYKSSRVKAPGSYLENERLNYWFPEEQIKKLYKLLYCIKKEVPQGKYRDFFLCAYSNILRGCSRWLTKSIKPQVDPNKKILEVLESFEKQFNVMFKANKELEITSKQQTNISIINANYLDVNIKEKSADVVITSPPYVTSYEYADLHQLSTLWLGFAEDYRDLRKGTIGSLYSTEIEISPNNLNSIGTEIIKKIQKVDKSKVKSISKYFSDIKKSAQKTYKILNNKAIAFFIIGNTQYKGVYVDNAKYLTCCLLEEGFEEVEIYKREIGSKILTRYRDKKGRFTTNPKARKVYNVEFIIIAKK